METSRLQKLWNNPGPDNGWSWVIMGNAFIFLSLTAGFLTTGSGSIYFVEFSTVFQATRKEAALPFSVMGFSQCIAGLLTGMIFSCFDMRLVIFICIMLLASALALCFVAPNLLFIALCLGTVLGSTATVVYTGCLVLIQQYFQKYLATANGVLTTSVPLAGSFLPYLINHLIEQYGLRGSLLLYGGLLLQLIILTPLMRPRTERHFPVLAIKHHNKRLLENTSDSLQQDRKESSSVYRIVKSLSTYKTVVTQPMFYVITIPAIVTMSVLTGVAMILMDFALDMGLTRGNGLFLVAVFSSADVLGRVIVGFVADRGWLARETLSMLGSLIMATSLVFLGWIQHIYWIIVIITLTGLGEGCVSSITNVLYPKYLNAEDVSTAMGLRMCSAGILSIFRPLLIGYLRDAFQTHIHFYFILGSSCLLSALLWFPIIFCRKKKVAQIQSVAIPLNPTNNEEQIHTSIIDVRRMKNEDVV